MTSNRFINRIGPKPGFVVPIRVLHRRGSQPGLPISSRMTASGHDPPRRLPKGTGRSPPDARTAGYTGRDEEKAPHSNSVSGLLFNHTGPRALNPRPPEPHPGALPDRP